LNPNTRPILRAVPLVGMLALAVLSLVGCSKHPFSSASGASTPAVSSATGSSAASGSTGGSTGGSTSGSTSGGGLPAADALSPSAQAEYCKRTSPLDIALPSEDGHRQSTSDLKAQSQIFAELSTYSPSGLHSDVALLATDYQALADGSRTLPQVDGEVRTSFRRVMDYRNLICLTEEERQKQAGN